MSLMELISAAGGFGMALSVALFGYHSFGVVGAILGIPIGYLMGFYMVAFIFMGVFLLIETIEKFKQYWKS